MRCIRLGGRLNGTFRNTVEGRDRDTPKGTTRPAKTTRHGHPELRGRSCLDSQNGVEAFSPDTVSEASRRRLQQAQATGARYIVSACQQCMRTLYNGARSHKIRVRPIDISQLVLESVEAADGRTASA